MATKKLQIIGNIATIDDVAAVQSEVNALEVIVEDKVSQTDFDEAAGRISTNEAAIGTLNTAVAEKAKQDDLDEAIAKIAVNETAIAENTAAIESIIEITPEEVDALFADSAAE